MSRELNEIRLINADGILQQDEWNREVYAKYAMKPLKEDSSRRFVEVIRFPEFNDARGRADEQREEDDNDEQDASQAAGVAGAAGAAGAVLAETFVALAVGAALITGSYAAAKAKAAENGTASVSGIHWEWSDDHTRADVVVMSGDEELRIPADVSVEEKTYCTAEGEVAFHAKAAAGNGMSYYDTYTEAVPAKGHDFEVDSTGVDDTGAYYADYVCTSCGEHFVMNVELTTDK